MTLCRICRSCARVFPETELIRGRCRTCGPIYERDKSRRRRATSTATSTRNSSAWQRARQLARQRDGGCIYRDRHDCHGQLQVHHVIPLERGGSNALSNLVTLCRRHHEQAEPRSLETPLHTRRINFREGNGEEDWEGPSIG